MLISRLLKCPAFFLLPINKVVFQIAAILKKIIYNQIDKFRIVSEKLEELFLGYCDVPSSLLLYFQKLPDHRFIKLLE